MNEDQFFYWLKGLADTNDIPTAAQWNTMIKELRDIGGTKKRQENTVLKPISYCSPYLGTQGSC